MKIIYLDLDGVINSLSHKPPKQHTNWLEEWNEKRIEGYRILWSSELVEAFNQLAAREDVTIKFLTTWRDLARSSFGPQVGLNGSSEWPYLGADDSELFDARNWWKLDRIQKDLKVEEPEKAVWIDDDIKNDPSALNWMKDQEASVLAISPESTFGVTKSQIELIIEFLDADLEALESDTDYITVN